jgi:hypothetical protein
MYLLVLLLNAVMAYYLGKIIMQNVDLYEVGINFLYILSYIEIKLKERGLIKDDRIVEDMIEVLFISDGVKRYRMVESNKFNSNEINIIQNNLVYDTILYYKIDSGMNITKNLVGEKINWDDLELIKECTYLFLNIDMNIIYDDGSSENLDVKLKSTNMNYNFYYIGNEFSLSFWKYYLNKYCDITKGINYVILYVMDDNIVTHIIDKTEVLKIGEEKLIIKKI